MKKTGFENAQNQCVVVSLWRSPNNRSQVIEHGQLSAIPDRRSLLKQTWAKDRADRASTAKRQVRTSAATIGIILSAGASNLLLTQLSDSAPAAAAIQPSLDRMPMATVADLTSSSFSSLKAVAPKQVTATFSTLVTAKPLELQATKVLTAPWVGELRSPTGQLAMTLPVGMNRSHTNAPLVESSVTKPTQKTAKVLQALRVNRLIRQLKASRITASTATLASRLDAQETAIAKQRLLIDRLKESHRLQASSAELGFEEWQQSAETLNREQVGTSLANNNRVRPAVSLLAFNPQLQVPHLTASSATGAAMPYVLETLPGRGMSAATQAAVPKIVVDRPMVLVPVQAINYKVKAGDTLTAIAHQHGIPLSGLIAANQLADPNRIAIAQRLIVPMSSPQETESQIAAAPNNAASAGMGGNISEDDSVVATNPQNVAEIQRQQSAAAIQAQNGDRYVQNLRNDIQKLQQRYRNQPLLSQATPGENSTAKSQSGDRLLRKLRQISSVERQEKQELNSKQATKTLQIEAPKQPQRLVRPSRTEDESGDSLATAPIGRDASDSLQPNQRSVSPALPPLGSVDTYLPKPAISKKGFMWPARGKLSSVYGWRWGRMHRGIDIAAPIGTPIYAAAAGVVIKSGWNSGGYGNLVDIQHADGTITRYAHNKRLLVQKGQVVYQGQLVSEMGSTGFSTGSHLHFEIHPLGKKAVNPIAFLPR